MLTQEATVPPVDSEALLSHYFEDYVDRGRPGPIHLLRHPRQSLAALRALRELPVLHARLSESVEATAVRTGLVHKEGFGRTMIHSASAVLVLPDEPTAYAEGPSRQTLRRKARSALKAGVSWRPVDDPAERQRLVALSAERERNHGLAEYRTAGDQNAELLDYRLWLVAYADDDTPLLLSVTPYDGEWALLRYFRTLQESPAASDARYLMTQVLVEQLVERGVRYLTDHSSPIGLSNGLRHFQRMLGFRIHRVEVERAG